MQKLTIILIFGLLLGCSPKIKSIIEYQKNGKEFIARKLTEFDKNGNKVLSKGLGNSRSNRIITTEFKNNRKISVKSCDYFKNHDTCVVRSFSKFEFDKKTGIEKQTLFESDSAVRFIRETRRLKKMEITKTYTWEFFPTKNPKIEKAFILIDTTYLDYKGRKIKSIHHNNKREKPWIEIFEYSKHGFSEQTIGTAVDTIIEYKIGDLQRKMDKRKIDYKFFNSENFKYEIENY